MNLKMLFASAMTLCASFFANADELPDVKLKSGDRLAIIGDSITEQKMYTRYIEAYILACSGLKDVSVMQFGWGGERAGGCVGRMERDILKWKPTVATLLYGMNDGTYRAYDEKSIGLPYKNAMSKIAERFKNEKIITVIGSPSNVDTNYFRGNKDNIAIIYNENLAELGKLGHAVAVENDAAFADINTLCAKVMADAKQALGEKYPVMGGDGVHPSENGQLIIAYGFLKKLGFDGNIGWIVYDMKSGVGKGADGHEVLESKDNVITVESSKWPFTFPPIVKNDDPRNPATILPYLEFNSALNRFILKVENPSPFVRVTWNGFAKDYPAEAIAKGINIAADAPPQTPFSKKWNELMNQLIRKQQFETWYVKSMINGRRGVEQMCNGLDNEIFESYDSYLGVLENQNNKLMKEIREKVSPVKYTVSFESVPEIEFAQWTALK